MMAAAKRATALDADIKVVHWRDGLRATVASDGAVTEHNRKMGACIATRVDGKRISYGFAA